MHAFVLQRGESFLFVDGRHCTSTHEAKGADRQDRGFVVVRVWGGAVSKVEHEPGHHRHGYAAAQVQLQGFMSEYSTATQ